MNRVMLESIFRRTLVEMKDSPERSTRRLVDLGVDLCRGRFRDEFLLSAQAALENPNSAYYRLVQDTVFHVDTDKLLDFGFNIGYNGFAEGSETIRKIEKKECYDIPWCLTLEISDEKLNEYSDIIAQGEKLGIHLWILHAEYLTHTLFDVMGSHKKSSFILCVPPASLEGDMVKTADELNNLMIAVKYTEGVTDEDEMLAVCRLLRENGLLYSVYTPYTERDVDTIISDDLITQVESYNPVMFFLSPDYKCPMSVRKRVFSYVNRTRKKQQYKTILWDLYYDTNHIDSIISDNCCQAAFNKVGALVSYQKKKIYTEYNLFEQKLCDILRSAFPKKAATING